MGDDALSLFGVRAPGEPGFYRPESDFLVVMPELLTKGAVFAVDKTSWISHWLENSGIPKNRMHDDVREALSYLIDVLDACRTAELQDVFDSTRINPFVYQAIMMGIGCVALRRFNSLFRKARFTRLDHRGITEPIARVDKAAAMRLFDTLYVKTSQS